MTTKKEQSKAPQSGTDDARSVDDEKSRKERQEAVDKAAEMTSQVLRDQK